MSEFSLHVDNIYFICVKRYSMYVFTIKLLLRLVHSENSQLHCLFKRLGLRSHAYCVLFSFHFNSFET